MLLPGTFGDRRSWLRQVAALSRRHRLVLLDPRGTGGTPDPGAAFGPADLAQDVLDVLDRAGVERAHVAGHSLGAAVAIELAAAHPERVAGLVAVAPVLTVGARLAALLDTWEALARSPVPDHALHMALVLDAFGPAAFERLVPTVVAAMDAAPMDRATILRYIDCDRRQDLRVAASRVRAPALVVAGELDALAGAAEARAVAAAVPGARLEVLAGAGHSPHLETAADFNRLLAGFLAGI